MAVQAADRAPMPGILEQFDFVAFIDKRPIRLPPHRCLAPVFVQSTFQIYAVSHNLDCAGTDG